MLFYALPSLNAERQKLFEPVTYRGMDPHHLLILLNNTRYHNSAWKNTGVPKSDLGRGSTSNDLSSIPFAAIEKIAVRVRKNNPPLGQMDGHSTVKLSVSKK